MRIQAIVILTVVIMSIFLQKSVHGKNKRERYRKKSIHYPKDTIWWVTDFFTKGCVNFIHNCPRDYKYQEICARNYNDEFKYFPNYCEMQYENCNTWRNWKIFKREKC